MPLTADLSLKLDASSVVEDFLEQLGGSAGAIGSISIPTDPQRLSDASAAGGAFRPTPILDAVGRFGAVVLPDIELPATLQRLETSLQTLETLTTRDIGADLSGLAQQLAAELEQANAQGVPGTVLRVTELLRGSAFGPLLGQALTRGGLPAGIGEALPAFASTIRVLAGLMVYETVLAEGERFTGVVRSLFDAGRAHQHASALQQSLTFGSTPLAQALTAASPTDTQRIEALAAAVENAADQLDDLKGYVAHGMGFGEATLVHFDVGAAQTSIAVAGALLRDPDLGSLRRCIDAVAQQLQPLANLLDPGDAAARGLEELLQLAESQSEQAATAIRNLDASVLVQPFTEGVAAITRPLRDFSSVVTEVVTEVRALFEQVRAAVAALPIDDLAEAIRSALEPVTQALQLVQRLVDDIRTALQTAAQAALTALGTLETNVDAFQKQITDLFEEAQEFVEGLNLDQVVASISDRVNEFVGLLQQAQLKPYFDTASEAIDTAADVIEEVPLELLPESMKADLDAALAPVRDAQPEAVASEIKSLLQIGPNGEFQLRDELDLTLAGIQAKFDQLLALLDEHHPGRYVEQLDQQLGALASQIQSISPQLSLEPIQQAIAQVKSALGSFDLSDALAPVQAAFDSVIAKLDEFSPAALLQPLQQRVVEARQKLQTVIRIDEWRPMLDRIAEAVQKQLDVLDPTAIENLLRMLLSSLRDEIASVPNFGAGNWLGMLVAGLMRGSNLQIDASSIESVLRWAGGGSPSTELSAHATRIAEALASARTQVDAFAPSALGAHVTAAEAVRAAARTLAAKLTAGSHQRIRLEAGANRLDAAAAFASLSANRARYLQVLGSAATLADSLRRTGMSEADVAVEQLRQAFAPLAPVLAKVRQLGAYLGLAGSQTGSGAILQRVLSVATPERLAALFTRLFRALRDRLMRLVDDLLTPIRTAITDLQALIGLFDLQPIIDGIQSVFQEVRTQVLAYSPNVLLQPQLAAFNTLKQTLLTFDPIGVIVALLNSVRDTAARVIGKLSAQKLLEAPIAIYDEVVDALRELNVAELLAPVLDVLDSIALQVSEGLDDTVDAFTRLQESLPPPGGGSSISVSVEVT